MFRELVGINNNLKIKDIFKPNKEFKKIDHLIGDVYAVDVYEYKDNIVKHYIQKDNYNKSVKATSLRNGVLKIGFNEKIIKDFKEE